MAAPDIVLQLVPYPAIVPLQELACTGTDNQWIQALCPALGRVLQVHRTAETRIPSQVLCLVGWLAERAQSVYDRLAQHDPAPSMDPRL